MICHYLSIYSSDAFRWQVATCSARQENYIPSIADLEDLCRQDHSRCPFFASTRKTVNSKKENLVFQPSPAC
ncbi:MAG: hypothetical protein KKA54_07035 [Proteobacteria bacterium]|nr:hypothetical protein [Pseudomonadota bacterium]MBU0966119.1 hypothetical protein [Pseudomonadota bacterium]